MSLRSLRSVLQQLSNLNKQHEKYFFPEIIHTLTSHPTHTDWFVLTLTILFLFNLYIILAPASWFPWLWGVLNVVPFSNWMFKLGLLELALLYIVFSYFIEVTSYINLYLQAASHWMLREQTVGKFGLMTKQMSLLFKARRVWPRVILLLLMQNDTS